MTEHKFKAGETVTVIEPHENDNKRPGYGLPPYGKFQIVRPLPTEHGRLQYRVKSDLDGHERVVREHEIA